MNPGGLCEAKPNLLNIINDRITIDFETTEKRKKEIEELTKDLWN
jgi:hypothetical protein